MASDFGLQTSVTMCVSTTYAKSTNWSTPPVTPSSFPLTEALLVGPE